MTEGRVEATEESRGPHRWRYLIDIIVLVAVTFLLDAVLGAFVRVPIDWEKGFVLDAIVKVLLVGVGCGLVLLRGERLADIGLKRPESWTRTLIIGIGLAAIVFLAIYLSEKAGFRRDLSRFKEVQGNLQLMVFCVSYAFIGAGFYEEFTFRGFLMQGLAMLFGGTRGAWIGACLAQGALFGLVHAYQNPLGIAITGTLGYDVNYIRRFQRPDGTTVLRLVTDRPIRFGEAWTDSRSSDYNLSGVEIVLSKDKKKTKGTLLPACQFKIDRKTNLRSKRLRIPGR